MKIAKKMTKIFFLDTKGGCNNFCIGCAGPPSQNLKDGLSTPFLVKEMKKARKLGYKKFHLVGGELTIQKNIFELLREGRKIFDRICFTSNGRMFTYYDFAKKFSKLKVNNIRITLCGHNSKIHEAWTRTPNSFNETVKGIKNLISLNQPLQVNILVWKKNFKNIKKIIETILLLRVKNLSLFNIAPLGRARKIYKDIVVDLPDLPEINKQLKNYLEAFENIDIEDFPQCIFEPIFFEKRNVHIFDTSGCVYLDNKGRLNNFSVFSAQEKKLPINSKLYLNPKLLTSALTGFKVKMSICSNCFYSQNCSGVFNEYLRLKGEKEVNKELSILRNLNKI